MRETYLVPARESQAGTLAPLGIQCVRIDPRPASELIPGGPAQPRPAAEAQSLAVKAKARCGHRPPRPARPLGCHAAPGRSMRKISQ